MAITLPSAMGAGIGVFERRRGLRFPVARGGA